MTTRRRVEAVAADSGFRTDIVEKVLRLCVILERLDRHPTTRGAWLLKGGTALNLLHDEGVVAAEALHADRTVQERIRSQPMLQWKAQNVREHRRGR